MFDDTELNNLIVASFGKEEAANEQKPEEFNAKTQEGEELEGGSVATDATNDANKPKVEVEIVKKAEDATSTKDYLTTLKQHGLLYLPDDFKEEGKDEEEIWETAQTYTQNVYMNNAVQSLLSSVPEDLRQAISLAVSGSEDYAKIFTNTNTVIETETPEGRISAIKTYYKDVMNWPDNRIEKHLSKLDESDIEDEAEEAKASIEEWKAEQLNQSIEAAKAAKQAEEARILNYQKSIKEEIKNASFIEAERKNVIQNFMFNPVKKQDGVMTDYQRVIQKIQQNPAHMTQLADLLLEYDDKKGIAYDRFKKSAKTSLAQDLQRSLQKTVSEKTKQVADSNIDWKSFIQNM